MGDDELRMPAGKLGPNSGSQPARLGEGTHHLLQPLLGQDLRLVAEDAARLADIECARRVEPRRPAAVQRGRDREWLAGELDTAEAA